MSHARQQIRDAVVTTLTGLATTGSRVYSGRVHPLDVLPALTVWTPDERIEYDAMGTTQSRLLVLVVEGRARATASLDDTLDTIAAEVEAAMMADRSQGVGAQETSLERIETELEAGAEQPTGLIRLTWEITYRVDGTDPTTIL